jgi:dienelactone hydrolase
VNRLSVRLVCGATFVGAACALWTTPANAQTLTGPAHGRHRIEITSTIDGTLQPSYIVVPDQDARTAAPRPLLVILHTWNFDLEQQFVAVERETDRRGWLLLEPNFRGASDHPGGCGSLPAQQDILDAVAWVRTHYAVDPSRIYLEGWSGGGFMTLLMAARYPDLWAAASAGAGISDLAAWYAEHSNDEFGANLRACFSGAPSESDAIARLYREQSPLTHLRPGLTVPLDLAAGKDDPQVSVRHSLRAFRAIAPESLSEGDIEAIVSGSDRPQAGQEAVTDPLIPRRIFLRRTTANSRLTIFDGKHEWFHLSSLDWLAQHQRTYDR